MRFSEHLKKASLVGAFFVFVVSSLQAQALCPASGPLSLVKVATVIDGDTLRLTDGRRVRLIGLNAPEVGRKGRSAEPFAEAAKRRLQAVVKASGGRISLRLGEASKDHYGRILAHAFDEHGENLEAVLLADGLGFFVAIAPNTLLVDCHRAVEQQARLAGKGVWHESPIISTERVRRGGFALVRARVDRLVTNRGGVWLELDGSLVLQVPHEVVAAFADSLAELPGKQVEARGWVIDRKGRVDVSRQARWMLKISHPSMLVPLP
ncbi:nuclease [Stutzerimonas stutzeri]|uniref:Nuclease n=1 Tax=Stutzerimonas stutzeri TaxID=316 RepID=W8R3F6_STUST|nr:thermonuclease family protein [Stutzerimonas stutzeri]AHL74023.1 nuclease [Stutzerimonas stutzeri]MCQ4328453.1 thermonuclease family protein [Stutzerimonas stutzeri]